MKHLTVLMSVFFLAISTGFSQQTEADISDAELQQFADAYTAVQEVNNATQQKMVKSIEDAGMEVERYTEIQQAQQAPDQDANVPEEELLVYQQAMKKVQEHQNVFQQNVNATITKSGLSMDRYQEIMAMVQTNQELQQKLQEYL
jgi:endonuclease III